MNEDEDDAGGKDGSFPLVTRRNKIIDQVRIEQTSSSLRGRTNQCSNVSQAVEYHVEEFPDKPIHN